MTTTDDRTHAAQPTSDEIVAKLREISREKVAERVSYLLSLDGDDPDEQPTDLVSLREFANLLENNWKLPDPRIGVNPEGLLSIEWFLTPDGILAMTFEANGSVRFYAAFDESDHPPGCAPVSSTLEPWEALIAVQPFLSLLPPR